VETVANRTECRWARRAGILGLAGAALVFGVSKLGVAALGGDERPAPAVCGAWHRGGGESEPFDLERTRRGYEELGQLLSQSLRRSVEKELAVAKTKGYDSGLPACGRSGERRLRPGREVPPELRGKTLWLIPLEGRKHPVFPEKVKTDPTILALATKAVGLESLEVASKVLGRPVTLLPRGLADALGVRCAPALLSISPDGEVEIHENP
jgi:hypothetical protein